MAYSANVPVDINESFSVSQPKITENFGLINTVISVDHVTFDVAGLSGKHKQVTFPQQTVTPAVFPLLTTATEMQIYCATDGAVPALFLRKESQAVGVVTADINFTTATKAAVGTCTLPCGIIMKWGIGAIAGGSQTSAAITFPVAFTGVFNVMVTPTGMMPGAAQDSVLHVTNLSAASFQVTRNNSYKGTTVNFFYLAIGV